MDDDQLEILLGLIFAAGRIERYSQKGHWGYAAIFTGRLDEEDFMQEKLDEFRKAIPAKVRILPYRANRGSSKGDGVRSTGTRRSRFRVRSPKLEIAWNLLYPNGYRQVTQVLLSMLSQRAAAWLWAENAKPHRYGTQLKRVGETRTQAEMTQLWLRGLTGAQGSIIQETRQPRILFEGPEETLVQQALAPYAPFSQRAKFRQPVGER